jgi:hypothetical protein
MHLSMPLQDSLTLCLAIDRLTQADSNHYAVWVLESPFPGGYAHHDRIWDGSVAQLWDSWQQFFSLRALPQVPHVPSAFVPQFHLDDLLDQVAPASPQVSGYTGRLMQGLGIELWEWLFDGPIRQSLERSLGIAMGLNQPLHLRLDIRAPDLITLPWEIMQPQPGRPAIALGPQILFSRTTSAVDLLTATDPDQALRILLVLGQGDVGEVASAGRSADQVLQLPQEAQVLKDLLELSASRILRKSIERVICQVKTLVEPDPETLTKTLEAGNFNVFFYAGHGVPAPDGGLLFLQAGVTMGGTELAQVLTRCGLRLAVFNTCWGAQPDQQHQRVIPRSSLAEVLLHHGIPAVIAMRDSIADEEALSFIQVLAQGLADRQPIERAMAIARQHLLTVYQFNQPAWSLPVLYLHPQFDGRLLHPVSQAVTQIPDQGGAASPAAVMRRVDRPGSSWPLRGGVMRVGRLPDNDLVIMEPWVSGQHAEIFCRNALLEGGEHSRYYLRDNSRNGSYYYNGEAWQHVHRAEVPLPLGTRLRFGSLEGQLLEFIYSGSLSEE